MSLAVDLPAAPPAAPASPGRRLAAAVAIAAALVLGANAWVGLRLPALLQDLGPATIDELDRRVAACPDPAGVRLLLLGNSHVQAGLRPPDVAAAFGLPPGAVFSLAIVGASPLTAELLFRRHGPRFPGARAVLVGTGGYFLTTRPDADIRYMTRADGAARWRWASRRDGAEAAVAASAVRFFPIMDFKAPLLAALRQDPARFARRLGEDAPDPASLPARVRASAWPWGVPPAWDVMTAAERGALQAAGRTEGGRRWRAEHVWPRPAGPAIATGARDLAALVATVEAAGLPVALAETPIVPALRAAVQAHEPAGVAAYAAALAPWRPLPPPEGLAPADWFDVDHLEPAGSRKWAAWVAAKLAAGPWAAALRAPGYKTP